MRRTVVNDGLDDQMDHPTGGGDIPDSVLDVVQLAVQEDLLSSIESLAAGLTRCDWVPATGAGLWRHRTASVWRIASSDHAPNASIFLFGSDEVVADAEKRIREGIDGGSVGEVCRTIEDPHWTIWAGGDVVISLNAEPARHHERHPVPAIMQLALERSDTPSEGLPSDSERARRIAGTGSPLQRWYLAAERDLPDDVVALLRQDNEISRSENHA